MKAVLLALCCAALASCTRAPVAVAHAAEVVPVDAGVVDAGVRDAGIVVIEEGAPGVWGGPCEVDADCAGQGAKCLRGSFPRGTCSAPCVAQCNAMIGDRAGVCAATKQLPKDAAAALGPGGACLAACDYGRFRHGGCRTGYGCVPLERPSGKVMQYACMPGAGIELTQCQKDLAALGVSFEPIFKSEEAPKFLDGARCEIEDPVLLHPPLLGVEFLTGDKRRNDIIASCAMARALAGAIGNWKTQHVATVVHFGTYSCRKIKGKPRLSRHADGDAIDVGGFVLDDGRAISVVRDWKKGDNGKALAGLIDAARAQGPWSTIITPDDNWDHRDHVHLDLKGAAPGIEGRWRWIEPSSR